MDITLLPVDGVVIGMGMLGPGDLLPGRLPRALRVARLTSALRTIDRVLRNRLKESELIVKLIAVTGCITHDVLSLVFRVDCHAQ